VSIPTFTFTDRARPFLEIGIGDSRIPTGQALWDVAKWDAPTALWAGTEPTWLDFTCEGFSFDFELGRPRTTDRFVAGSLTIEVDNRSGWADPEATADPASLSMRPGRALRIGVDHDVYGHVVLFRGIIDALRPTYEPADRDRVTLQVIDVLGEVNRAKFAGQGTPVGAGETVTQRLDRILTLANWPDTLRVLDNATTAVIGDELNGQAADLMGRAADSAGGVIFGSRDGEIVFRPRDWQTYIAGSPPDGTIGNVDPTDVCPVQWVRPFDRADIATRAIMGRDVETALVVDDLDGQIVYGIEPFERTDLWTQVNSDLQTLADRALRVRSWETAPVVRGVSLDARTGDDALDLMTTADPYLPSRYRCRLLYDRGLVFDGEYFATGAVVHIDPNAWTLSLHLDNAAPYASIAGRWDVGGWDRTTWGIAV
jgi:hypothetical protein